MKYRQERRRNDMPQLVELTTKCQQLAAVVRRLHAEMSALRREQDRLKADIPMAIATAIMDAEEGGV